MPLYVKFIKCNTVSLNSDNILIVNKISRFKLQKNQRSRSSFPAYKKKKTWKFFVFGAFINSSIHFSTLSYNLRKEQPAGRIRYGILSVH